MTAKKFVSIILCFIMAVTIYPSVYASGGAVSTEGKEVSGYAKIELSSFDVPCKNAILISADTGDVLYEKNPNEKVPIASITKIMTLILTFDAINAGKIAYSDIVPISEHAFEMGGSQIWLEPEEQFTLDELLKAICVSSANDAAVAVAEYVGGSEGVFVDMMNKKAAELGMVNTSFKNACGLDEDNHLSTAADVAIMSRKLLNYGEDITKYTTIWMDTLRAGATQLTNTNKLLKKYSGINGLKTGTTGKAGVCISASAVRDDMGLIAVVLGATNSKDRFTAAMELLDYGFANFEALPFPNIADKCEILPVHMGAVKEVKLNYLIPNKILIKKGDSEKLKITQTLPEFTQAPIVKNTQVGVVTVSVGEEKISEYQILADGNVDKMSFNAGMSLLLNGLISL